MRCNVCGGRGEIDPIRPPADAPPPSSRPSDEELLADLEALERELGIDPRRGEG
jgi:hypothetical protein